MASAIGSEMRCATGLSWSRPSTRCAAGVLVLAEWDRATGSLMEGISIVERVHKRGADLTTPSRRCILALLSGPAEAERTRILRRAPTRAASPPSSAGSRFGRKPKLDDQQQQDAVRRLKAGESCRAISRTYRVTMQLSQGWQARTGAAACPARVAPITAGAGTGTSGPSTVAARTEGHAWRRAVAP
jgi:hypothetical protein